MFAQLKPLLDIRALTLTLAAMPEGKIRVCVVPQSIENDKGANHKIGYGQKSEVAGIPDSAMKALTTPLSLTGTPEELDSKLPELIANYVEKHIDLKQTFDQACSEITEAVDLIKERDKNKTKAKKQAPSKHEEKDDGGSGEESDDPEKKAAEARKSSEELPLFWCKPEGSVPVAPSGQTNLLDEVKH